MNFNWIARLTFYDNWIVMYWLQKYGSWLCFPIIDPNYDSRLWIPIFVPVIWWGSTLPIFSSPIHLISSHMSIITFSQASLSWNCCHTKVGISVFLDQQVDPPHYLKLVVDPWASNRTTSAARSGTLRPRPILGASGALLGTRDTNLAFIFPPLHLPID